MNPVTQPMGPCPCEQDICSVLGTKIAKVSGHLVGCRCRSCIGRNNRSRGQRSEARAHRQLGGTGPTVRDDLFHVYSIDISLENKSGSKDIPATFSKFAALEWTRRAFRQAEKKKPVGTDAFPAIRLELSPSDAYLVVKLGGRGLR